MRSSFEIIDLLDGWMDGVCMRSSLKIIDLMDRGSAHAQFS